jgi:hypothetical protein
MLAGHETVAKAVSKPDALFRGSTSNNTGFVDNICIMGAREAAQGPAQASGRSHKGVRGDQGTREGGPHAERHR